MMLAWNPSWLGCLHCAVSTRLEKKAAGGTEFAGCFERLNQCLLARIGEQNAKPTTLCQQVERFVSARPLVTGCWQVTQSTASSMAAVGSKLRYRAASLEAEHNAERRFDLELLGEVLAHLLEFFLRTKVGDRSQQFRVRSASTPSVASACEGLAEKLARN